MTDNELKTILLSLARLFEQDGWKRLEAEWLLEREKIIALGKKHVEDGKTEAAAYAMSELCGFDRAFAVPGKFKHMIEQAILESKQEEGIDAV